MICARLPAQWSECQAIRIGNFGATSPGGGRARRQRLEEDGKNGIAVPVAADQADLV
jgi:hypothetical protein